MADERHPALHALPFLYGLYKTNDWLVKYSNVQRSCIGPKSVVFQQQNGRWLKGQKDRYVTWVANAGEPDAHVCSD